MARKILLADDSVTAQNMGRRILSDAGYEVITVNNGSAALKKIAEITPDLIVLDVYMPGYGGLEVCQRLKESQATNRIPVLLTVGKLEPFKVEEARRVRADAHIVKPFDSTELLAAIIKLEDKIVPQAAPNKPGRGTKSATETSSSRKSRDKSADPASESSMGWKKRLSIPPVASPEDRQESTPASAGTAFQDFGGIDSRKPVESKSPEVSPANAIPQETAPDEKLASARPFENFTVEHIKTLEAAVPATESVTPLEETEKTGSAESSPLSDVVHFDPLTAEPVPITKAESAPVDNSPSKAEVDAALASLSPARMEPAKSAQQVDEAAISADTIELKLKQFNDELPVSALATSMAAVGDVCGGPRWVAQAVPLSDGDSHLLLESEMERVYASFSAAESAQTSALTNEPANESSVMESSAIQSAPLSVPEQILSESQPASTPVLELNTTPAIAESSPSEDITPQMDIDTAAPVLAESVPDAVAAVEATPPSGTAWVDLKPTPAPQELPSTGFREIAYAAVASAGSQAAVQPGRAEVTFRVVESLARSASVDVEVPVQELAAEAGASDSAELVHAKEPVAEAPTEVDKAADKEKNKEQESRLAAAWHEWKQIRESVVGPQLTSQIADAAAAGFKQLRDEEESSAREKDDQAAAAASDRAATEASTIAGIVDSVFAELKPKLMEEIAKKLAAERK